MRPLRLVALALTASALACSSGGGEPPKGFSIVYTAPGAEAGVGTNDDGGAGANGGGGADASDGGGASDDAAADAGTGIADANDDANDAAADAGTGAADANTDATADASADVGAEAGTGVADAGTDASVAAPPAVPSFHSIRGSGPGAAWAVGDNGMAVALSGNKWTPVPTGSTATLGGLSMFTLSTAYAVELGGARVLGWNGRGWGPVGTDRADRAAAATLGLSAKDVWVAGNGVEHWDGQSWTQVVPSGALYTSISASFETDIWAVGPGGIQHFDGKRWSALSVPTGAGALRAVWVSALWDAWFVGAGGTVLHWDGQNIVQLPSGTTKDLTCVSGTSAIDVWAGGQDGTLINWNGGQWIAYATPAGRTLNDVWRALDAAIYFVDDTGTIAELVP